MPHDLPKAYEPGAIEPRWAEYWVREKLFHAEIPPPDSRQETFTITLPPPNVTGNLHMGHMLEHTEIDIIVRWKRMSGLPTLWLPGTDHAGIATQLMVERQLASRGQEPPRHRPRSLHRARVGLEAALRRRHPAADEAPRHLGRLVARILHHGRAHVARRPRSFRPPL